MKPKSISNQIVFISQLILVRSYRICSKICFLLSHQLFSPLDTAVSAADLFEFQDDWWWPIKLTKHWYFSTFSCLDEKKQHEQVKKSHGFAFNTSEATL